MKKIIYLAFTILIFMGCSNPKKYSIDFYTNLNSENECEPSASSFNVGDWVYVLLDCNQPFTENVITGNFYVIENSNKIPLGSQDWIINSGDSYAYDYIDFTERGTYEFEFLNEQGIVLVKNKLEIK